MSKWIFWLRMFTHMSIHATIIKCRNAYRPQNDSNAGKFIAVWLLCKQSHLGRVSYSEVVNKRNETMLNHGMICCRNNLLVRHGSSTTKYCSNKWLICLKLPLFAPPKWNDSVAYFDVNTLCAGALPTTVRDPSGTDSTNDV